MLVVADAGKALLGNIQEKVSAHCSEAYHAELSF
jgi:hypothetical protein